MKSRIGKCYTRRPEVSAGLAIVLICLAGVGYSQTLSWVPEKPVELIASSAPGGSTDKSARVMQKILQDEKLLPVPVSVVNKPGGNQTLALAYLNQHAGDAHYLSTGNPPLISNRIMGSSTQHYSDFTPIALLLREYTVFTVRVDSPIKSVPDLLAGLRKDPESIAIGITTRGGTNHLVLSLAAKAAGVDVKRLKVVSFRSNSESMTALLGGHLQLVASSATPAIGQARAGNTRILAIASPRRMSGALAGVPTLREHGIITSVSNWRAVLGPKGLVPAQVSFWEAALAKVVASNEWKKDMEAQFWVGDFLIGKEFRKFLEDEEDELKAILTELGLAK